MRTVWKILGFLFTFISPFAIVYLQYTVFTEEGMNIELKGVIVVLFSIFSLVKYLEHKKNVLEIQDKSPMFRVVYTGFKRIFITVGLYWIITMIDDNIADLVLTLQLLTATLIIGFLFNVLGNLKKKK